MINRNYQYHPNRYQANHVLPFPSKSLPRTSCYPIPIQTITVQISAFLWFLVTIQPNTAQTYSYQLPYSNVNEIPWSPQIWCDPPSRWVRRQVTSDHVLGSILSLKFFFFTHLRMYYFIIYRSISRILYFPFFPEYEFTAAAQCKNKVVEVEAAAAGAPVTLTLWSYEPLVDYCIIALIWLSESRHAASFHFALCVHRRRRGGGDILISSRFGCWLTWLTLLA